MNRISFCFLCLITLASCGGESSDSGSTTGDTDSSDEQVSGLDLGLKCERVIHVDDLSNEPVYTFEGLWSNWQNGEDLAGFSEAGKFTGALSNLTAVAYERGDSQLKETLVDSLYRWASQDAFVGTQLCWQDGTDCTQWQDPAGYDVSDGQSYNFVLLNVENQRKMYAYLSDWAKTEAPEKHQRIARWFQYWEDTMPQPAEVAFGLGTGGYQWKIQQLIDKGDLDSAREYASVLVEGMEAKILDDGSISERTTRGDSALWYHFTALNEIMESVRLYEDLGLGSIGFEQKIHGAVNLFISTIEEPSYILPWASVGLANGGDGTQQYFGSIPNDFSGWYHTSSNGTWVHIYMNKYPDHDNSLKLREMLPEGSIASAYQDDQTFPLACMLF